MPNLPLHLASEAHKKGSRILGILHVKTSGKLSQIHVKLLSKNAQIAL